MNEKTARQIAEMKNQTIGVEVEMNSITRQKAAKEQHHPPEGSEGCRRLLRHRQIREHCQPQRVQHLVGLGCGWARVEIPEGCFHRRAGRAEMRTGHPDPDLRRHRNPAGALQAAQTRRSEKRRQPGLRSPHPHRGAGTHAAEPSEPRQHHGQPREPDCRGAEARPGPHEPLLPHGRPTVFGTGQPQEASLNGAPCGHLVHQQRRKLRQEPPLQRQPLPYAQPPRNLYQRDGRVPALPVR